FSGSFFIQQQTSAVTFAFANVSLVLTAGGQPLVSGTAASGGFILTKGTGGGLAGVATGTVSVAASTGISVTGVFKVAMNSTSTHVTQTITVNGTPIVIDLPAGPLPASAN